MVNIWDTNLVEDDVDDLSNMLNYSDMMGENSANVAMGFWTSVSLYIIRLNLGKMTAIPAFTWDEIKDSWITWYNWDAIAISILPVKMLYNINF